MSVQSMDPVQDAEQSMDTEKVSVPGFTEEQIAHLSPRQRQKLADEQSGGRKAAKAHADALDYNRKLMEKATAEDPERPKLDAEAIVAARIAASNLAEKRAEEQQAINALANANKEALDHDENTNGRTGIPAHIAPHITDAAIQIAADRTEQATAAGLTAGTAFNGHPERTEGQADAVLANATKEASDLAQAGGVPVAQGHYDGTQAIALGRVPVFDDAGILKGVNVNGVFEPDPDYEHTPAAQSQNQNGQADQTSEPNADEVLAAGLGADDATTGKRGRRAPRPASTNSSPIGNGPVSE